MGEIGLASIEGEGFAGDVVCPQVNEPVSAVVPGPGVAPRRLRQPQVSPVGYAPQAVLTYFLCRVHAHDDAVVPWRLRHSAYSLTGSVVHPWPQASQTQ